MSNKKSPIPGKAIRKYFPIFSSCKKLGPDGEEERELGFLDSAASTQKPLQVIERLANYLSNEHANIHRGAYALSAKATENYESTRKAVCSFINAPSPKGVIFTRGTTEAFNLLSHSLENFFIPGDTILLSILEHHSNIVPWQLLAKRRGLRLQFIDSNDDASLNVDDFRRKLKEHKPRLVSITHIANSFGTVVPIELVAYEARRAGALVAVDAAQSIAHRAIDMQSLGIDFLAFSGHKMYGPTGVGGLVCREEMYQYMEPFQGGGDMISSVEIEGSSWAEPPYKFEAGTPAIAEVIALQEAISFLQEIGMERIETHEKELFAKAFEYLKKEEGVSVYGPASTGGAQTAVISFNVKGVHPHDLASISDGFNVQIRSGHHCAMPALKRMGLPSSARASMGIYSCLEDFETLAESIRYARKVFG